VFSRDSLVKQPTVAKTSPKAKPTPEYFSKEEISEANAPLFSYSLADLSAFASGEGETGSRVPRQLPIQAKLTVGAVDDPMEREANRVAEHVTRMPDAKATYAGVSVATLSLQRQCACGGSCDKCRSEEEHEHADHARGEEENDPEPPARRQGDGRGVMPDFLARIRPMAAV